MRSFFYTTILFLFLLSGYVLADDDFSFYLPNYSHYKFDNGFELILVENHTNPLIASVVVVRTGLRNEAPQDNGVSHMLEHMTFNGTEKRTQKELYDELDFYGIYLNAHTSEDYTAYMALNHKDQIDHALDIMSDMLFNSTFPPEKFEKEKGIIAEEIRRDSESPDFKKEQALRQAFYKEPPYSMPVIGTVATVQNMAREQVSDYYKKYYSPNNMIAIVIGDFSKEAMVEQIRSYFGKAAASQNPQRTITLRQNFPFLYTDDDKMGKVTYIKLPAPTFQSNEFIPFQFLNSYGLDDQSGVLLQKLKNQPDLKIKNIRTNYEYHPEFGTLTLTITTDKDVDSQLILAAVEREFENLKKAKISNEEIRAAKQERAISEILQTEKIMYYGFLKAQDLAMGGLDAFAKTIPAYLELPNKKIFQMMSSYPAAWKNPETLFKAGNWIQKVKLAKYTRPARKGEISSSRIFEGKLKNGLTVILLQNTDNPVLAMHFLFKNRSAWEPADKTGIADFLHHSLFKASRDFTKQELQLQIKNMGAEIKAYDWDFIPYDDYYNVPQYSYIRFVTLDQFFDQAVNLAANNILHPDLKAAFPEAKEEMTGLAGRQRGNASNTARLKFYQMLFGKDHPLAKPVSGTPATIAAIALPDLEAFHRQYFSAGNTILSIVSSLDSTSVFNAVEKYFGEMPQTEKMVEIPEIPLTVEKSADSTEIGSRQSYIYLGYTFDANAASANALEVMNNILSGRIAFSLREQKGWAYRLGSSIDSWKNRFYFTASMGTGRQTTIPAINGILEEIQKFKADTITSRDVERTRNSMQAALVRRRASRENQAFALGVNAFYGYPKSYFSSIYEEINRVTPASVTAARDSYLQTDVYKLFYTIPTEKPQKMESTPGMPMRMPH